MKTPLSRYDGGSQPTDPEIAEEIQAEHDRDCNQDYSSTGMCPCCGTELQIDETEHWTGANTAVVVVESQQLCEECGWMSVPLYDTF